MDMTISYNKLWELLTKLGLSVNQLKTEAGITANAITKMQTGEAVTLETLAKVCHSLGCQLGDIIEISGTSVPYTLIPDIDFSEFSESSKIQYNNLGFYSLYDLHIRLTHNSVLNFLISNYKSWFLNRGACEELLSMLENEGIHLEFPSNIEPDINSLPHTPPVKCNDEDDEQTVLFHQKLDNYLDWHFRKIDGDPNLENAIISKLRNRNDNSNQIIIENGILKKTSKTECFTFTGTTQYRMGVVETYPMNLINAIWGGNSDYYIYDNRLQDLTDALEAIVKDFPIVEKVLLLLREKYGLSSEEFVDIFELPDWKSILWSYDHSTAYQRAQRKLRHPKRNRQYRFLFYAASSDCNEICFEEKRMNPYRNIPSSVYENFLNQLKFVVAEGLAAEKTLEATLNPWYQQSVIAQVESNKSVWFRFPDIVLEDMELSWRAHYALSNAKIMNMNQVWETHGKAIPLTDYENTGLAHVIGLGQAECVEILNLLTLYMGAPLDASLAASIIEYAETLASDDQGLQAPYECLQDTVVYTLLKMGYRNIDAVLSDYQSGKLREKAAQCEDSSVASKVLNNINMLYSGEYPVRHYGFNSYWESVMRDNPGKSLQSLRETYIRDIPIKRKLKEFEVNIPTLFPEESWVFPLLYNTRTDHMQWFRISNDILKPIIGRFVESVVCSQLCSLYVGFVRKDWSRNEQYDTWFFAQIGDRITNGVFLKLSDAGELYPHCCDGEYIESLVPAIQFIGSLNKDPQRITDIWEGRYVQAQLRISRFYANDSDESTAQYFAKYTPSSITGERSWLLFITIDELDLSVRSFNCLKRANIHTVADLITRTGEDMMRVRNMGKKSLDEVRKKLGLLGLSLQDETILD